MTRAAEFEMLEVLHHPVIDVKMAKLRDRDTPSQDFRRILFELAGLMSASVFRHIKSASTQVGILSVS